MRVAWSYRLPTTRSPLIAHTRYWVPTCQLTTSHRPWPAPYIELITKRSTSSLVFMPAPKKPAWFVETSRRIWPAPSDQIKGAQDFIRECVDAHKRTLIVPHRDVDGLAAGAILHKSLVFLGLDPSLISAHILECGRDIHDESERKAMAAHEPAYIFILDQGSRKSPPVIDAPHKALVIDCYEALDGHFPKGAKYVTSCNSHPIATSAQLTYHICSALNKEVQNRCLWLCAIGTHGDLRSREAPFPSMKRVFDAYTPKELRDAVSLINSPRWIPGYRVLDVWDALTDASSPISLLENRMLRAAQAEATAKIAKHMHTVPVLSGDGKIAVIRINSLAQVHQGIAGLWAKQFKRSRILEVVLVANEGYTPGKVNFACRLAKCAKGRDPPVIVIKVVHSVVNRAPDPTFRWRVGESFVGGHQTAAGGSMPKAEFEEFLEILEVGKSKEPFDRSVAKAEIEEFLELKKKSEETSPIKTEEDSIAKQPRLKNIFRKLGLKPIEPGKKPENTSPIETEGDPDAK
ncbi:DHH family protein [Hypoxylon argillaceum]|nr:DHH family protein [Hypoxylon argillaceum]